jgi:multiple antibiotic resistance protein
MLGLAAHALQFALLAFTSIFFLVDPLAAIPTFLVITAGEAADERAKTAKTAAITCGIVLLGFAFAGTLIFRLFGITLAAFKIAGGVILMLIGLDMLRARRSPTKETIDETREGAEKENAGIIPLGIPMLAGPGSISTVMVLMGQSTEWWQAVSICLAILITAVLSYVILAGADRVRRYLGETGSRVLTRLMGLLLTAIAVQFIVSGLADLGVVRASTTNKMRSASRSSFSSAEAENRTAFPFQHLSTVNGGACFVWPLAPHNTQSDQDGLSDGGVGSMACSGGNENGVRAERSYPRLDF